MRILLDECVNGRLRHVLAGHHVRTVRQMRWTAMRNGALLALAATQLDVFLTVDQNLPYQQNAENLPLAVMVVKARSIDLPTLLPLVPRVLLALDAIAARRLMVVE